MQSRCVGLVVFGVVACSSERPSIRAEPPAQVAADGGSNADVPAAGAGVEVSGTRLKRRVLKGRDGSRQDAGWFDSERNENCSFVIAADGKLRCLPALMTFAAGTFQDAACKKVLVLQSKGCPAPSSASQSVTGNYSCATSGARVFPIGQVFEGANVYQLSGTSCIPSATSSLSSSFDLYVTGDEIPASAFVEAIEERL